MIVEPGPPIKVEVEGEDLVEPGLFQEPDLGEGASLVEVEEVPTHPGLSSVPNATDLADQDTELDPNRDHLRNPDGPVLTVPHTASPASPPTDDA